MDSSKVVIDSSSFVRKASLKSLYQPLFAFRKIKAFIANQNVVVSIRVELAKHQVLSNAQSFVNPAKVPTWLKVTDVMYARAEAISLQCKGMRPPTWYFVLLAYQYLLTCLCQCHGSR
jgi:hypothetical protein